MSRKARYEMQSDSSEYHKGYSDGMKAAFEESELDAYYAGVGYGKKAAGDKHIGFNNDEERQQFEAGIRNKGKHFRAYRAEPPTFLERLFGIGEARKEYKSEKKRFKRFNKMRKKYVTKVLNDVNETTNAVLNKLHEICLKICKDIQFKKTRKLLL